LALFAVQDLSAEIKRSEELRRLNRVAAEEIEQRRLAEERLQKTLEENTILLREHHHRTKNNFGMLLSLLELQKETLFDPRDEEIIEMLTNRIFSIQRVHEHLSMNTDSAEIDLEEYIRDMALDLLGESGSGEARLTIESDPIRLNLTQAIPVGMILAELMTNSLKHAFSAGDGLVSVEVRRSDENLIRIRYSDSGPGRPDQNPNELGLGVRLNEAFAQQLEGSYRQDSGPGAPTLIEFPLPAPPTT
jgi:two-component system response regulator